MNQDTNKTTTKRKRGRPVSLNKKYQVSFTLSPQAREKLERLVRLNNTSLSSIVETLLVNAPEDFRVVPKRSYNRRRVLDKI